MKNLTTLFLLFFLNSFIFATEFSVQGVLRDPLGRTVDDGNFVVTFKIYDVANGGTHLWFETHPIVKVQHGIFTELLGSITPMETLAFNEKYWIGITVANGQEMTPRTQLTTSPYSKAVLGDENVFPSVGNIGVGTQNPTAALHIISDEDNILHVTDSEGSKYIKINASGHMEISGDIQLTQNSAIRFYDNSNLTSSDLSGTASGLGNSESILIEAGEVIRLISGENEVEVTIDDGQLDVTGLEVKEDSKLKGALEVTGASALGGTLVVAGASDLNGALDVAGNSDLNGDLDVTGDSELDGALVVTGNSDLVGNLTVQKTAYLDTLYVSEGGQIGTTLYVGGASDLNGALAVAGKVNFSSSQDVNSTAGTGTLSIGPSTGAHMSIDGDEIQSRDQSGSSMLHLQREGGRLRIFNNLNTNSKLEVVGEAEFSDKVYINNSDDVNETAGTGGLNVGNISSYHIGIDPNEINAKNGANAGSLSLQHTFGSLSLLPENDTGDLRVFGRAFKTYADHHGFGYAYESVFFNIRNVPGKSKIFNVQGENEVSIWYISADGSVHDTQGSSTVLPDRMVANDPPENSLNNIMNLNIVKYNNRGYKYGLVLDQVDDIYPELVKTTMPDKDSLGVVSGDSYKSVNMTGISAITIQAIKELKIEKDAEVKAIKKDYDAKLAAMLARINNLENQ